MRASSGVDVSCTSRRTPWSRTMSSRSSSAAQVRGVAGSADSVGHAILLRVTAGKTMRRRVSARFRARAIDIAADAQRARRHAARTVTAHVTAPRHRLGA